MSLFDSIWLPVGASLLLGGVIVHGVMTEKEPRKGDLAVAPARNFPNTGWAPPNAEIGIIVDTVEPDTVSGVVSAYFVNGVQQDLSATGLADVLSRLGSHTIRRAALTRLFRKGKEIRL